MLAVRLTKDLDHRLNYLAEKTGRSRSYYVKEALTRYLEDEEDYILALSRLEKKNPRIPLKEVIRQLKSKKD